MWRIGSVIKYTAILVIITAVYVVTLTRVTGPGPQILYDPLRQEIYEIRYAYQVQDGDDLLRYFVPFLAPRRSEVFRIEGPIRYTSSVALYDGFLQDFQRTLDPRKQILELFEEASTLDFWVLKSHETDGSKLLPAAWRPLTKFPDSFNVVTVLLHNMSGDPPETNIRKILTALIFSPDATRRIYRYCFKTDEEDRWVGCKKQGYFG